MHVLLTWWKFSIVFSHKALFYNCFLYKNFFAIWHSTCYLFYLNIIGVPSYLKLGGKNMSAFSILYRNLHGEKKTKKKDQEDSSSSETKGSSQAEATVGPIRALIAKIF